MSFTKKNELKVNSKLLEFINKEVLPGTHINPENFWVKFSDAVHKLAPINRELILKREAIQKKNR